MKETPSPKDRPVKRAIPLPQRIWTWYLKLRLLNKLALWALIASIPAGLITVKVGRPYYRLWRQNNSLNLADSYIAKGDFRSASLAFREALRIDFKNRDVWKRLGKFLDAQKSPEVIWVWERLVFVEPAVAEHRYKLAEAALQHGDVAKADSALRGFDEKEKNTPRFLLISAGILAATNRPAEAEVQLETALARDPDNQAVSFRLDKLRLETAEGAKRDTAETQMRERARQSGPSGTEALRILAIAASARQDFVSASFYATQLKDRPDATVNDELLFLDQEFASNSLGLPSALAAAKESALKNFDRLNPLVNYLVRRGQTAQTLQWLESQPPEILQDPAVRPVRIDLNIAGAEWKKTLALLRAESTLPPEILNKIDKAYQAYESGNPEALALWSEALVASKGNLQALGIMERLASVWKWNDAGGTALWAIGEEVPNNAFVWRALLAREIPNKDTPTLANILTALVVAEPTDRSASNELLRMQFLLHRGDPVKLLETAKSNYELMPDSSELLATYVLYLALAGKASEVPPLLKGVPEQQLREPRKAVYFAYAAAKAGQSAQAKKILAEAETDESGMLPEEVILKDRALAVAEGREEGVKLEAVKRDSDAVLDQLRKARQTEESTAATSQELYKMLKQQRPEDSQKGTDEQMKRLRQEIERAAQPSPTP